jgi:hypothetical protein
MKRTLWAIVCLPIILFIVVCLVQSYCHEVVRDYKAARSAAIN